jgi:hypothetical protein
MAQQYYSSQQQQARPGRHAHHPITGAVTAAGLIRITATAHTFSTNNVVDISGVVGTVEANKAGWTITVIDANTFDLVGSTFVNAYVSGGVASLQ